MKQLSPLFPKPQDMSRGAALSWIKSTRKDANPLYRSVCSMALLGGLFALAVEAQPARADYENDTPINGQVQGDVSVKTGHELSILNGAQISGNLNTDSGSFFIIGQQSNDGIQMNSLNGLGDGVINGGLTLMNTSGSFGGKLTGSGSIALQYSATQILTGDASGYTGNIWLSGTGGNLQLGDGTHTGQLGANMLVINNQTFTIDQKAGDVVNLNTYLWSSGPGLGTLIQNGNGLTILNNTQPNSNIPGGFAGIVTINAGQLEIDTQGGVGTSATVSNGATILGTSSVNGDVSVASGGSIRAGTHDSTGAGQSTFTVAGNLNLASGTTTVVNASAQSIGTYTSSTTSKTYDQLAADLLKVQGTANLAGNLFLNLTQQSQLASGKGYAYHVLDAQGGISGTYDGGISSNLGSPYQFVDLTTEEDAAKQNLYILMELKKGGFDTAATTRNEHSVARALGGLPQGNELVGALLSLPNGQGRAALNNLSGEIHASVRTGLIQDSFFTRNAVLNRLSNEDCAYGRNGQSTYDMQTHRKNDATSCSSGHVVLWGQAYGSLGHNSGTGNAAGMGHNTAGFIMGMDAPIRGTNWRAGGLVSYGHSMFDVGGRSSSANSNNITVGGYAGTHWGALNLRMGATYSWNVINTRRQIAIGSYGGRVNSSYLGGTAQAFAELGYKLHAGRVTVEPFMNVAYINMQTNGFHEHGNAAALSGRGSDSGMTFSSFGFRAATQFSIGKMAFMPHLMGAYRHGFGRLGSRQKAGFATTGSNSGMDVSGVLLSSNAAVIDTGVTARLTNRVDVDLSYIGQYGNRSVDSGAMGSVKYRF